jgi:hypothetical protein
MMASAAVAPDQRELMAESLWGVASVNPGTAVVMSLYAAKIQRLAPDADPAHIEAWMR